MSHASSQAGRSARRASPSLLAAAFSILALSSCAAQGAGGTSNDRPQEILRLGYLPNLTHAPALLGVQSGLFRRHLAGAAKLEPRPFPAGPSAVEAMFAGALDVCYIGPAPAINGYTRSRGEAVRIISGATEGGTSLIVEKSIDGPGDLKGKRVASPQLGNSQDIALRTWLADNGLRTDLHGGGQVAVVPQDNAQTLDTFKLGQIAGAWLPEPWASRLVREAGGKVLVDERSLWPDGRFPTTVVVVRPQFLREEPSIVERFLNGHSSAVRMLETDRAGSLNKVNQLLAKETGMALPAPLLESAGRNLHFTSELDPDAFSAIAKRAKSLGLSKTASIKGAFDLRPFENSFRRSPTPQRARLG